MQRTYFPNNPALILTDGGSLGNITGYTGGKAISEGTGKGVNPVDEMGIELIVIEVA